MNEDDRPDVQGAPTPVSCLGQAQGLSRRGVLGLMAVPPFLGLTTACATRSRASDRIIDTANGQELSRETLMRTLQGADVVLLGELHDNPHHHQRRGDLVAALAPGAGVVAEQLPRGALVRGGTPPRAGLEAAGFDSRAWGWPLYSPLFGPVLSAGLPVRGGNAPLALVRRVAREGPAAWPPDLRARIEAAPLSAAAQSALDRELLDGHCGQLPPARLPAMRAAQLARDASMALAVLEARAAGGRPVVLLAGNGHVRLDRGVAPMPLAAQPSLRLVSVVFGEPGWQAEAWPANVLWITPPAEREDPCIGLRMRSHSAPPAASAPAPRP